MFDKAMAASRRLLISGLGLSLALALAAPPLRAQEAAQADEAAPTGASSAPSQGATVVQQADGPTEEVVVTGQRTLNSLINEAAIETQNFYDRLNVVLDDREFEIHCQNEAPPGSNIRVKVCRTRYMEELLSRQSLSQIQGIGTSDEGELVFNGTEYDIVPEAVQKQQEFAQKMLQAVNSDPQLNQSVRKLMQLKAAVQSYETPRQQARREAREDRASDSGDAE